jgi:type IV pilus assembly protein PilC
LRSAAGAIAQQLRSGVTLEDALANSERLLPNYMHRSLKAAVDVGQTAAVIEGVTRHESSRRRLRRQVATALLYPVIVMAMLAGVVALVTTYVVPQFADIYEDLSDDFNLNMPVTTNLLLRMAGAMPRAWRVAAVLLAVTAVLALIPAGRRVLFWLRTGLPIFGPIATLSAQHDFASIMAALTSQRVLAGDALRCTVASLHDRNLARAAAIAATKCEQGVSLSRSLAESIHFDPALPALVHWGEQNDAVASALLQATQGYEEQIELYVNLLRRSVPPVVLAMVAGVVFFFVSALLVPLILMLRQWSAWF